MAAFYARVRYIPCSHLTRFGIHELLGYLFLGFEIVGDFLFQTQVYFPPKSNQIVLASSFSDFCRRYPIQESDFSLK